MPSRHRATLLGVAAIGLWSALAALTTLTAGLPPFEVLALSFGIAGVAGLLCLRHPRGPGWSALRQPVAAWLLGSAALFGYHALYFLALKKAPAVEASLINYLWPLLIVLFAGLLPGTRLRRGQVVGTVLGLLGAVLVVTRGQGLAIASAHYPGYLAALAAALVWAAYSVANRRFAGVASAAIVGSVLTTAVLGALAHGFLESFVAPAPRQWAVISAMALGPVGAAFWLWDHGCKHGDLPLLGTLSYAAPLLSTALLLVLGQAQAHWTQAAAVALLLLGAGVSVRAGRRAP